MLVFTIQKTFCSVEFILMLHLYAAHNIVVEWLIFLSRVQRVQSSNLVLETRYSEQGFSCNLWYCDSICFEGLGKTTNTLLMLDWL
jgi:hypothetical protein